MVPSISSIAIVRKLLILILFTLTNFLNNLSNLYTGKSALLIDSNPVSQNAHKHLLNKLGISSTVADDKDDIDELIVSMSPDVIVASLSPIDVESQKNQLSTLKNYSDRLLILMPVSDESKIENQRSSCDCHIVAKPAFPDKLYLGLKNIWSDTEV